MYVKMGAVGTWWHCKTLHNPSRMERRLESDYQLRIRALGEVTLFLRIAKLYVLCFYQRQLKGFPPQGRGVKDGLGRGQREQLAATEAVGGGSVLTKCLHNKLGQSGICCNANSSTTSLRGETGHAEGLKGAGREKGDKELGWTLPRRAIPCTPS